MRIEQLGELRARVGGGTDGQGSGNGPLVVLMHGFGAPGNDLVGLARYLPSPQGTRFVFPEAPLALDEWGGRAWWMIDPELFERRARGEVVDRTDEQPAELPRVRQQMLTLLAALPEALGSADTPPVLGGFSQGSMLAMDVALHMERKPRALVLLSSTLIARTEWAGRMASCNGVPVFQSHGLHDPLLPFEAAETLRDMLLEAGAQVQFEAFRGGHEIPAPVVEQLTEFLHRHAST